jgi:hypothetical protein
MMCQGGGNTGTDMKKTNNHYGKRHTRSRLAMSAGVALALCALLAPQAHAQASDAVPNSEIGHATRAWLELQRSNAQAAPALPMLGAEAGSAWRRYQKSFDTPIPASFGSSIDTGQGQANSLNSAATSVNSN